MAIRIEKACDVKADTLRRMQLAYDLAQFCLYVEDIVVAPLEMMAAA
ncbi:MAG: plasmid maintenance system antidote protein [Novosphingobium sp.]